jgi:hypothetical protein
MRSTAITTTTSIPSDDRSPHFKANGLSARWRLGSPQPDDSYSSGVSPLRRQSIKVLATYFRSGDYPAPP